MNILITAFGLTGLFAGAVGGAVHAIRSGKVALFMGNSADDLKLTGYVLGFGLTGMAAGLGAGKGIDWIFEKAASPDPVAICIEKQPANTAMNIQTKPDGTVSCIYTPVQT